MATLKSGKLARRFSFERLLPGRFLLWFGERLVYSSWLGVC